MAAEPAEADAAALLLATYDEAASSLDLEPCSELRTALAGAVESGERLAELQLRSAGIGAEGAPALAAVLAFDGALQHLNLEDNALGDEGVVLLARALLDHPSVFRLDLGYNEMTGRGIRAIGELVAASPALRCLDLSGNNLYSRLPSLTPVSMSALAPLGRALASPNCRLQLLILDQADVDLTGLRALTDGLAHNVSLVNLRLGENELDARAATLLATLLRCNASLTSLDLRDNRIGDEGAQELARALESNARLRCLVLWKNEIGPTGATAIAQPLAAAPGVNEGARAASRVSSVNARVNAGASTSRGSSVEGAEGGRCALRILDLGGNAIGVAGIEALRGALGRNQTLHTLGLADARLGEEGGIEIAGVVEGNAQLQRLDLRRNALQVAGLMAIRLAMKTNRALLEVAPVASFTKVAGLMAIRLALKTNRALLEVALDAPSAGLDEQERLLQAMFVQEIKETCAANKKAAGAAVAAPAGAAMPAFPETNPPRTISGAMALLSKVGSSSPTPHARASPACATHSDVPTGSSVTPPAETPSEGRVDSDSAVHVGTGVRAGDGNHPASRLRAAAATFELQHDARLRQLGAAEAPLDVPLLGAGAAVCPPEARPPPSAGWVRVLQWNLLARGLAEDGFLVEDILDGDSKIEAVAVGSKEVAADRAERETSGPVLGTTVHGAAEAVHTEALPAGDARAQNNLTVILDAERRWARVQQVVASYAPDAITFQELDWMPEAMQSLEALGYACSLPGAPPSEAYTLPHLADTSASCPSDSNTHGDADTTSLARGLLVALEASGRAFAPKVKVALRRASPAGSSTQNIERHEGISGDGAVHASAAGVHAPKVQDGVAVFWRQDTWEASSLDFFLTEIKRKLSPSVRVNLVRPADGATLSVICTHLPSGSGAEAEVARLAVLNRPTLALLPSPEPAGESAKRRAEGGRGSEAREVGATPSIRAMLEAAAADRIPTLFCVDANSAPGQQSVPASVASTDPSVESETVWRSLNGIDGLRSVWERWFDSSGGTVAGPPPVTTNKMRGPLSPQKEKIGEHAFHCIDHIYYSHPGLDTPTHAYGPVVFPLGSEQARAALLPSVAVPSDHYPVIVDLHLHVRADTPGLSENVHAVMTEHWSEAAVSEAGHVTMAAPASAEKAIVSEEVATAVGAAGETENAAPAGTDDGATEMPAQTDGAKTTRVAAEEAVLARAVAENVELGQAARSEAGRVAMREVELDGARVVWEEAVGIESNDVANVAAHGEGTAGSLTDCSATEESTLAHVASKRYTGPEVPGMVAAEAAASCEAGRIGAEDTPIPGTQTAWVSAEHHIGEEQAARAFSNAGGLEAEATETAHAAALGSESTLAEEFATKHEAAHLAAAAVDAVPTGLGDAAEGSATHAQPLESDAPAATSAQHPLNMKARAAASTSCASSYPAFSAEWYASSASSMAVETEDERALASRSFGAATAPSVAESQFSVSAEAPAPKHNTTAKVVEGDFNAFFR